MWCVYIKPTILACCTDSVFMAWCRVLVGPYMIQKKLQEGKMSDNLMLQSLNAFKFSKTGSESLQENGTKY